jgi:hypothetical protein
MEGQVSNIRHAGRLLLIAAALLGSLLWFSSSASAKTTPELALSIRGTTDEFAGTSGEVRATQSAGGAEAISITSATPSVCEVRGYLWGPSEEPAPEREVVAAVGYLAPGTCTLVASVNATSTTEASEVSKSLTVSAYPLPGGQRPLPPFPELAFEAPTQAYLDGVQHLQAKSSRPGLQVVSMTPAVCTISPHAFEVQVKFLATGTWTLTASLPKTTEHEALEVTKSILVATAMFTSTPPTSAVVGGSYEVSASSAPGFAVRLGAEGACSFTYPNLEKTLPREREINTGPPGEAPKSPATVYFVKAGTCTITAGGSYLEERVSQSFTVAMGPPEQITFTSTAPSPAVVGDSYAPRVRSSADLEVTFSIATPFVCEIVSGPRGGEHVSLIAAGTCTIDVRVEGSSPGQGPEAHQSFTVQAAPLSTPTAISSPRTPTSFKLIGHPRVDHRSAAIKLKASCNTPGTLSWRVTFKGTRGVVAAGVGVFGTGAMKVSRASTRTLTVKPTKAALRALERAHKHGHGLSVNALLTFRPTSGASPASLERSIVVRLA